MATKIVARVHLRPDMRSSSLDFFVVLVVAVVVAVGIDLLVDRGMGIVGIAVATALVIALANAAGASVAVGSGAVSAATVVTAGISLGFCIADGNAKGAGSGDGPAFRFESFPRVPKNAPMPINPMTSTAPATMATTLLEEPRGALVCPSGMAGVSDASIVEPIAAVA